MKQKPNHTLTGKQIRQSFINFFQEKADHTFVRSSSLVPGGDTTLLFTNAGMVQFKDIFLGTEKRSYTRAVNSQKCLRVAGKHNDLEDVGQDDTHHTFFEMLGNWSFGDYYKKEAIEWAWELLTEIWAIPKEHLYATVFKDEFGEIPTDEEAAEHWRLQPGFNHEHLYFLGRKDNFWEMADTGPCGPCSEIHIDLRPDEGPVTADTLDTDRFTELWNLVFIQYNRTSPTNLNPLPATHVDTGLGFERIVSILQGTGSNYRTDLFWPLIQTIKGITEQSDDEIEENFTPYRVIADHARAAAFLIADGVVPGNMGRNYICRMVIRRAFRFGGKIDINHPFLARVASTVIEHYGDAYPELDQNKEVILATITREEEQFQNTLDKANSQLESLIISVGEKEDSIISGAKAAELYTTYGMPFEITRDIAMESGIEVDHRGFMKAMDEHRQVSGAGKAMGDHGGEDVELFTNLRNKLQSDGLIPGGEVSYEPYGQIQDLIFESEILAIVRNGHLIETAVQGDEVEIILPKTKFYKEAGGQVSDTGIIKPSNMAQVGDTINSRFLVEIFNVRRPAAGLITHMGTIITGTLRVGDNVEVQIDGQRRMDIMRNHTATHLLHSALHFVLGNHARQAGSLVAPDRLRFDFIHPQALTQGEIEKIEAYVNNKILANNELNISYKSLNKALADGAIALFGEKYEEEVRSITIGEEPPFSNELCGGTHVDKTGDIGTFIITSEGSAAAGIRRIEAVTGRESYGIIQERFRTLSQTAEIFGTSIDQIVDKSKNLVIDSKELRKQINHLRKEFASLNFSAILDETIKINGLDLLTAKITDVEVESLRQMADRFRQKYPKNGIAVLASIVDDRPIIIAVVTQDLNQRGINAGELANFVAQQLGGGGGGKPTLAQAGGKDPSKIDEALNSVTKWVKNSLH